jgi:hypothetical protein
LVQNREQRLQKLENKLEALVMELKALRESQTVPSQASPKQPIKPKPMKVHPPVPKPAQTSRQYRINFRVFGPGLDGK